MALHGFVGEWEWAWLECAFAAEAEVSGDSGIPQGVLPGVQWLGALRDLLEPSPWAQTPSRQRVDFECLLFSFLLLVLTEEE